MAISGKYFIKNRDRYIHPHVNMLVYRSKWELKFMQYCEAQALIKVWGYECIEIPYLYSIDGRVHRYYPDFYVEFHNGKKYIIEIKPENQATGQGSLYNKLCYVKNNDKWKACKAYCESKGMEFKVVTEKDLF